MAAAFLLTWSGLASAGSLSPEVRQALDAQAADQELSVLVEFDDRMNLENWFSEGASKSVRRSTLVSVLREQAVLSQGPMRRFLEDRGAVHVVSLWAVNIMAVTATGDVVRELVILPGVAEVRLDRRIAAPKTAMVGAADPEWNLEMVGAPDLWDKGFDGSGVVVAVVDTGVDALHQDLGPRWRGGTNSWFDPNGEYDQPHDRDGHGTGVAGLIVGGDAGGTAIGVAPGAQWIGVKIFDDSGEATLSGIHEAFQWLLDPDGDPATDDAPDIVNNSWGFPANPDECYLEFAEDIAVLRAAEIAVVFSGGNTGPSTASSISPGNNPGAFPVGGVNDAAEVMTASARGPSACGGGFFPVVVAPGDGVWTADLTLGGIFPDMYAGVAGTSIAVPHVAGAMALLLDAHPQATVEQLETAIRNGAQDLGDDGPDNSFGWGLLDLVEAEDILVQLVDGPVNAVTFTDESLFLAAILGQETFQEGFEDDAAWGAVRLPATAPSVTSQGITWASNHLENSVTTGSGPARSGAWGFYSAPHGDPNVTDPDAFITDGFGGSAAVALGAVGGWFTGTFGSSIVLILDGDEAHPIALGPVESGHWFYGAVVEGGFTVFEFRETEGTVEDPKLIFADDFTIALTLPTGNNPPEGTIDLPIGNPTIEGGQLVFFTGSASDPDGDPVTVLWDFGDGTTSTQLSPGNHSYVNIGTYTITFTATDDRGLSDPTPDTRTVVVMPRVSPDTTGVVAGVAALQGLQGSDWHTDLYLHNASPVDIVAELYYSPAGESVDRQAARQIIVGANETLAVEDAVATLFGVQGSGAIHWEVVSGDETRLMVAGNTYNRVDGVRRYGQQVPGVRWSEAASSGTSLFVPAAAGRYRTNLGFSTDRDCTQMLVRGYDRFGELQVSDSFEVPPLTWVQLNQLFRQFFPGLVSNPDQVEVADSLHRFEVIGLNGKVVAYTSLIDNVSNDGSYLLGQWMPAASESLWLPAAAFLDGVNNSQWRSEVIIMNPGANDGGSNFRFYPSGEDNGGLVDVRGVSLAAGGSGFVGNVLADLFAYQVPAVGSFEVVSGFAAPSLVWMRTYTEEPADGAGPVTYGQAIAPRRANETVSWGHEGRIYGFNHDATTRSNLILQNVRADGTGQLVASTVLVEVFDAQGRLVHDRIYTLRAGEYFQHNLFIESYGLGTATDAGLRVTILNDGSDTDTGGVDAMVAETNGNSQLGTNDSRLLRAEVVPQTGN